MSEEIAEIPAKLRRNAKSIEEAARSAHALFDGRRQWVTIGRGTSGHAANYAHYLVTRRTGRAPIDLRPAAVGAMPANAYDDAVVVAFSASGQSTDVAATAAAARRAGAKVVSIANANGAKVRLNEVSDQLIDVQMGVENAVPATKSFLGQLLAAAALSGEQIVQAAEEIATSIEEIPDALIEELTTFVAPARRIIYIARGACLGIAEDATLKTAETARRPAATWSAAEVLHGPLPSIGPEDRVVVFGDGADFQDSLNAAVKGLQSTGAPVASVAMNGLAIAADETYHLGLPSARWARPLPLAVVSERVALTLAERAGLDPDAPPGLNKITLT